MVLKPREGQFGLFAVSEKKSGWTFSRSHCCLQARVTHDLLRLHPGVQDSSVVSEFRRRCTYETGDAIAVAHRHEFIHWISPCQNIRTLHIAIKTASTNTPGILSRILDHGPACRSELFAMGSAKPNSARLTARSSAHLSWAPKRSGGRKRQHPQGQAIASQACPVRGNFLHPGNRTHAVGSGHSSVRQPVSIRGRAPGSLPWPRIHTHHPH